MIGQVTPRPEHRRFVGDPTIYRESDRNACLYGAAMMIKVGRLPADMTAVDVHFEPPASMVFVSADARQIELARFTIPGRVLTYRPKAIALPPSTDGEAA